MSDNFSFLLNERISAIIDKYKNVDDSLEVQINIKEKKTKTRKKYLFQCKPNVQNMKEHEFDRLLKLTGNIKNFYELYDMIFYNNNL